MVTEKELSAVHEYLLASKRATQMKSKKFLYGGLCSVWVIALIAMGIFKLYVPILIFAMAPTFIILCVLDDQKRRIQLLKDKRYTVLKEEAVFKTERTSYNTNITTFSESSSDRTQTAMYLITKDSNNKYHARTCSPPTHHKASPQDIVYIISYLQNGLMTGASKGISRSCETLEGFEELYKLEHHCFVVPMSLIVECVFEKELSN